MPCCKKLPKRWGFVSRTSVKRVLTKHTVVKDERLEKNTRPETAIWKIRWIRYGSDKENYSSILRQE